MYRRIHVSYRKTVVLSRMALHAGFLGGTALLNHHVMPLFRSGDLSFNRSFVSTQKNSWLSKREGSHIHTKK